MTKRRKQSGKKGSPSAESRAEGEAMIEQALFLVPSQSKPISSSSSRHTHHRIEEEDLEERELEDEEEERHYHHRDRSHHHHRRHHQSQEEETLSSRNSRSRSSSPRRDSQSPTRGPRSQSTVSTESPYAMTQRLVALEKAIVSLSAGMTGDESDGRIALSSNYSEVTVDIGELRSKLSAATDLWENQRRLRPPCDEGSPDSVEWQRAWQIQQSP